MRVDPGRIDVVYPGTDAAWRPSDAAARAGARAAWCRDPRAPLVVLIGAVGHDANKGLDTVLAAWRRLARRGGWDGELVIAGPGDTSRWRALASNLPTVRFTGHIPNAGQLLDAADLLVSPVRYEAYGLAVHEAICRGVPALVSRTAGVVERFPPEFGELILDAPTDVEAIAARLVSWRADVGAWRRRVEPLGEALRADTLDAMCTAIARVGDALGAGAAA